MLAVEQSRGDTFFGQQYQFEDYRTVDMEFYPQHYQQQPEESLWFASTEHADVKPQMTRTTSSNSAYQHDFAPGLSASNGSIRSGSSSTVGSPYSGPSLEYSQEESYLYDTGVMTGMPAIVSQDAFAMDGTVDYSSEVPMPFEKLDGSVGESRLSSAQAQHVKACSISDQESAQLSASLANTPTSCTTTRVLSCSSTPSPQQCFVPSKFKSPSTPASAYPKTPTTSSSPQSSRNVMSDGIYNDGGQPLYAQCNAFALAQGNASFQVQYYGQTPSGQMPVNSYCPFSFSPVHACSAISFCQSHHRAHLIISRILS
jgi:hypothetical protein